MGLKFAILDTNILDYGFKPEYAKSVSEFIEALSKDYDIVTTQFSRFELFRGMASAKIPMAKSFFDTFSCFDITGDVFKIAAALSTCYKNDETTKSRASSFSDGDIIIGAAGFVNDAVIITSDLNDFPRPYFTESSRKYPNLNSTKKKNSFIAVGVLEPNVSYLNENISKHYPPTE